MFRSDEQPPRSVALYWCQDVTIASHVLVRMMARNHLSSEKQEFAKKVPFFSFFLSSEKPASRYGVLERLLWCRRIFFAQISCLSDFSDFSGRSWRLGVKKNKKVQAKSFKEKTF